jgi:trans-2-enoyl-CoA reductase
MDTRPSYYDVLGVGRDDDPDTIRRAFKQRVLSKHPDHGGNEDEFRLLQTAYEVLSDWRKRRIYDRYGEDGLDLSNEALFTTAFRGGAFGPDKNRELVDELQTLRKANESLQRQLTVVKPEATSKYASSFESWLRNRSPEDLRVITSETLQHELGVLEGSYQPTSLPPLTSERVELTDIGELPAVARRSRCALPDKLGWNQILVAWLVCPISAVDHHLARWGFLPETDVPAHPFVAGTEGVGLVVAAGPGCDRIKTNDLVVPVRPALGTWQTLGVHQARDMAPFPPLSLEPAQIASFLALCTAYRLLDAYGSIRPGDTIIQSNADSAVGQAVIQLCKVLHLESINLVADQDGFDEVDDALRAQGATHVWKDSGSVASRIKRTRTALPRLGFDNLGGSTLHRIAECLRPGATLVSYGAAQPKIDPFPFVPLMHRDVELRGFWLYRWLGDSWDNFERVVDHLIPLMEEGRLELKLRLVSASEDIQAALESRHATCLTFNTLDRARGLAEELAQAAETSAPPRA